MTIKATKGTTVFDDLEYMNYYDELDSESVRLILSDPHIKSKVKIISDNANDFPLSWSDKDIKSEVLDYVKKQFESFDLKNLNKWILNAKYYGQSFIELIWNSDENNNQYLEKLKPIQNEYIEFDEKGNAIKVMDGKRLSSNMKFLIIKNDPDQYYVNGQSIFTKTIYNLVVFKKRAIILLDQLLDKFGVPSVVVLLEEAGNDEAKKQEIVDNVSAKMESLRSGAGIALEGIKDITTLKVTGSATDFEKSIAMADEAMSKLLLGTGRTTDSGNKGSYASDKTSENVIYRGAKDDNRLLEFWHNQVIRWIVDNKYGIDEKAPKREYDRSDSYIFEHLVKGLEIGLEVEEKELRKYIPKSSKDEENIKIAIQESSPEFSEKKKPLLKIL